MIRLSWIRFLIIIALMLVSIGIDSPLYAQNSCSLACSSSDQCCGGQCVPTSFTCCGNVPSNGTVCCPDNKTTCPSGQVCCPIINKGITTYACCTACCESSTCCMAPQICCGGFCCPASDSTCIDGSCYKTGSVQCGNEIFPPGSKCPSQFRPSSEMQQSVNKKTRS